MPVAAPVFVREEHENAPAAEDDFVTIARVIKPQGRKGEVAAALLTDFPERFALRRRLLALDKDKQGRRRTLELEQHWFHKGLVILKFKGLDSISDAEALAGCEIQVPRSQRAPLDAGAMYVSDLIGCAVYNRSVAVGTVEEVQLGSGSAPLLMVRGAQQYLIPFAVEYITQISLAEKRLEMQLPEGMLELDAPLTEEEKQQQRRTG